MCILIDNVHQISYFLDESEENIMTTATQVRIDLDVKKEANALFAALGIDMSTAINMFLHQCIMKGGLPFSVEVPNYNQKTLDAMEEAKRIAKDPNVKSYNSIKELNKALDEDW